MRDENISALVAARLCHDLISPMGAIGNGIELLELSSGNRGEEIALISDSLETALAKLRFFRIAFGPADTGSRIRSEEAPAITDAMFSGRFAIKWAEPALPADLPRPLVRMTFLAILCLEKSLPLGGTVRISISEESTSLSVEGHRLSAEPELWEHLRTGAPLTEPRSNSVQFPLLRETLDATGTAVSVQISETGACIRLGQKPAQPA